MKPIHCKILSAQQRRLVGHRTRAQNRQRFRCWWWSVRNIGEHVVSPTVVVVNAVTTATVPIQCGCTQSRARKQVVRRGAFPGLRHDHGSNNLAITATAVVRNTLTDNQNGSVPAEVAAHCQGSGYKQDAVPVYVTGE